jgi:hypothetical protein
MDSSHLYSYLKQRGSGSISLGVLAIVPIQSGSLQNATNAIALSSYGFFHYS